MYILQSLHGDLSGSHFSIYWRKICSVTQSLISGRTKFQGLDSRYGNVSVKQLLHYISENLRLNYMENWLH